MTPNQSKAGMPMSERPKRGVPEGLWIRCPQCKATIFRKEAESRLQRLPRVRATTSTCRPASASRNCSTRTASRSGSPTCGPCDPLEFKDRLPYAERLQGGAGQDGHARRGRGGPGLHPRPAGRLRRHRLRLHGRQHGLGGRREADAGRRGGDAAAAAADLRQRLRRRGPHAGGHPVADADGQGLGRPGAATTRPAACTSRS